MTIFPWITSVVCLVTDAFYFTIYLLAYPFDVVHFMYTAHTQPRRYFIKIQCNLLIDKVENRA